jgi:hypothetical protein
MCSEHVVDIKNSASNVHQIGVREIDKELRNRRICTRELGIVWL